jgi:hypothetical protein
MLGAIFGQEQPIGWAAPEQSPYEQTIPPRPPTRPPTPTAASAPPEAPRPAEPSATSPSNANDHQNSDDDDGETALPGQASSQNEAEAQHTVLSPVQSAAEDTEPQEGSVPQPVQQAEERHQLSTNDVTPDQPETASDLPVPQQVQDNGSKSAEGGSTSVRIVVTPQANQELEEADLILISEPETFSHHVTSLNWLCAFGLGVIFILLGWLLVNRASRR